MTPSETIVIASAVAFIIWKDSDSKEGQMMREYKLKDLKNAVQEYIKENKDKDNDKVE